MGHYLIFSDKGILDMLETKLRAGLRIKVHMHNNDSSNQSAAEVLLREYPDQVQFLDNLDFIDEAMTDVILVDGKHGRVETNKDLNTASIFINMPTLIENRSLMLGFY